jgi:hypothetical protein
LRDAALTAYQNALEARSETVGDNQVVHQDIEKLANELSRWENVVSGLEASAAGVSNWRVRTPKWTS